MGIPADELPPIIRKPIDFRNVRDCLTVLFGMDLQFVVESRGGGSVQASVQIPRRWKLGTGVTLSAGTKSVA